MSRIKALVISSMAVLCLGPNRIWADPNLSDTQNYQEGIKLHQQGHYEDAYEFYFKDMSPTPKNQKWLSDYQMKYLVTAQPALPKANEPVAALTTASPSSTAKKTSLFFCLGGAAPVGPEEFSTFWKAGTNGGLGVGLKVTRITTVQFDLHYSSFALDGKEMNNMLYRVTRDPDAYSVDYAGGAAHILSALVNAKLHFTGSDAKVKPYFIGGLGIGVLSTGETTVSYLGDYEIVPSYSESKLEVRLGLGIDFKIGPSTFFFIEDNGYSLATEDESTTAGSFDLGLRFNI
jgi:outer membrane protein W